MYFTIVIATRNRSALVRQAIDSVLRQSWTDWEIVLVNDGSDDVHTPALAELVQSLEPRCRRLDLPQRAQGHGPSYALNAGVELAGGRYVGFLDDDDLWTDDQHLARVARVIDACAEAPDLVLANQHAYRDGVLVPGAVWIEDLLQRAGRPLICDDTGAFVVTPDDLLRSTGFAHVNTTIIRRAYLEQIGGFDETLRYEGDRDFYLRAIDAAASILYLPDVVARHNIPDARARTNMSTSMDSLAKRLYQLHLLDKAILFSTHPAIRKYAMQHKVYTLKTISHELAAERRHALALFYALEAGWIGFNPRWSAYLLLLLWRRLRR